MKIKISSLMGLLVVCLVVPTTGNAEIGKRPDVPNTFVSEIGNGYWVRVSAKFDTIEHFNNEEVADTYTKRAQIVADWACAFWDRKAVVMSVSRTDYLFACAME